MAWGAPVEVMMMWEFLENVCEAKQRVDLEGQPRPNAKAPDEQALV